jgi:hypothetical protein
MRPSRAYNPEPRPRSIIKLQNLGSNRYLVHGPGRSGMQYRHRCGIPQDVLAALDHGRPVFVFATVGRDGRWHLENIAPDQAW